MQCRNFERPFEKLKCIAGKALFLGFLFFAFETAQAEQITIYTTELDGHHQPDLSGDYDQIVLSAAGIVGLDVELRFLPPARAIVQFSRCEDCCVSPCNSAPDISHCPGATLSDVWDKVELHAFNMAPGELDVSIGNLKKLNVGAIQGMPLGAAVDKNVTNIKRVATPQAAIEMLNLGRLDVFLGWIPETLAYFKANNIPIPKYNPETPVKSVPIGIACKGPKSMRLIEAVNTYLRQTPLTSDAVPRPAASSDGRPQASRFN